MRKDIITAASIALWLCGCPTGAPTNAPVPEDVPVSVPKPTPTTDKERRPALDRHLTALKDKQRCNRVMGCEPAIGLTQLGSAAVPRLLDALSAQALDGRYWQVRAIMLLGAAKDPRALPLLHEALEQSRWELRARSAVALASIGDTQSTPHLQAVLGRHHDLATDAAAMFALHVLGQSIADQPARDALVAALPREQTPLGALNPGHFAFLAELVGTAQLRQSLQLARWGAIHRDRFTRMASLITIALLKDRDGIPYAITRLDDPSPGVKRQALRTLRLITGRRAFTEPDHWRDWCEQRKCLDPIRGLVSTTVPGRAIEPGGQDTRPGNIRRDEEQLKQGDHRKEGRSSTKGQD